MPQKWILYLVCDLYAVTNKKPHHLLITKLKKFKGAPSFVRRTQWTVEQLRQVNGINPNKVSSFIAYPCLYRESIYLSIYSDYLSV